MTLGGGITVALTRPKRQAASSSSANPATKAAGDEPHATASARSRLPQPSGQGARTPGRTSPGCRGRAARTVSIVSRKRPGRADITPTRSASIAASSSECVISSTVAPVSRQTRNSSSPISSRVCWSSAPNGSSSRMRRGPHHQGARDAHALPHAAGELRGVGGAEVAQPHQLDRVAHPPVDLSRGDARLAQAEADIRLHRQPREARILLEHHADAVRHAVDRGGPRTRPGRQSAGSARPGCRAGWTCRSRTAPPRRRTRPGAGRGPAGPAHAGRRTTG